MSYQNHNKRQNLTKLLARKAVSSSNHDKEKTPKLPKGLRLGTQEEATAINNGGAMQLIINRRSKIIN